MRSGVSMYKCPECDREFPTSQGLNMHVLRKHKGVGPGHGPTIPCTICNKQLAPQYIARHIRMKHPMNAVKERRESSPTTMMNAVVLDTESRAKGTAPTVRYTPSKFKELKGFVLLEDSD